MTTLTPKQLASYEKAKAKFYAADQAAKAAWAFWKSPAAGHIETTAGREAYQNCKAADAAVNRARGVFHRVRNKLGFWV